MTSKLNLGGGEDWKRDGWTNLERKTGWDLEVKGLGDAHDVEKIYASHSLEHLNVKKAFRQP